MSPVFGNRHPRGDLSAYADDALSGGDRQRIEQHLAGCAQCAAELDQVTGVREALSALPQDPAPRSFALSPSQVTRGASTPQRASPGLAGGLRLVSAGLAMALAVVIVVDAGSGGDDGSSGGGVTSESVRDDSYDSGGEMAGPDEQDADRMVTPPAPEAEPTPGNGGTGDGSTGGTGGSGGGVGDVETGGDDGGATGGGTGGGAAPTAPPTKAMTPTPAPMRDLTASPAPAEENAAGADDGAEEGDRAEAAQGGDDGDGALLALEVLLAIGAVAAFAGSVYVMRSARRTS
jgi:hypothetical protein